MKLKGLFMSAAILTPITMVPMGVFAAEDGDMTTSNVLAEVVSGGQTIVAKDANFGKLTIGTTPENVKVPDLLTVKDHTGGDGFEVRVKATNYDDTHETMKTQAHLEYDVDLTSADQLVQTGPSQLKSQVFSGEISGDWGVIPKSGEFSQDLLWTVTPKASPGEDIDNDVSETAFRKVMSETKASNGANIEYNAESLFVNMTDGQSMTYTTRANQYQVIETAGGDYHININLIAEPNGGLSRSSSLDGITDGGLIDDASDTRATFNFKLKMPEKLASGLGMNEMIDRVESNAETNNGIDVTKEAIDSQDVFTGKGRVAEFTPKYTVHLKNGKQITVDLFVTVNYL